MPRFITPRGSTVYIPGVYSLVNAIVNLPGPMPEFHVPLIVGNAPQGVPFDVVDKREDHETDDFYRYRGTTTGAAAVFGKDAELVEAMTWAARAGLGGAYLVCISALTRASVVVTSAGPVNELRLYPRLYGAPPGYIKVKWTAGGAVSLTPVKRFSLLTADADAGATRLWVTDNSWAVDGGSFELGDNATANEVVTVAGTGQVRNSAGQISRYIDLTTGLSGTFEVAEYALLVEYDNNNTEQTTGIADTAALSAWVRASSALLDAVELGSFTGAAPVAFLASATPLKDITTWGTVTDGTSPVATSTQHDDLLADLDGGGFDRFARTEQLIPRAWMIADPDAAAHASWRDWAAFMRTSREIPQIVVTGCDWGDTVVGAGDSTDPVYRAGVLNSQDVQLVAGGLDYRPAYLTLAAYVFGLRCAGGVGHNLTGDEMTYAAIEHEWDEINSGDLTALHKGGVTTYRLRLAGTIRYVVSQGLSTLQTNIQAWNADTNTTCLVMQRDLADATDAAMRDAFYIQHGADQVTPDSIAGVALARASQLVRRGWLQPGSFSINSIVLDDSGAGYNVDWNGRPPVTADFIGSTFNLIVG